jgi:hypothetical protein
MTCTATQHSIVYHAANVAPKTLHCTATHNSMKSQDTLDITYIGIYICAVDACGVTPWQVRNSSASAMLAMLGIMPEAGHG